MSKHLVCSHTVYLQCQISTFYKMFRHIVLTYQNVDDKRKYLNDALYLIKMYHEENICSDELVAYLHTMLTGFAEAINPIPKHNLKEKRNFIDFLIICLFGFVHDDTLDENKVSYAYQSQESPLYDRPFPNLKAD